MPEDARNRYLAELDSVLPMPRERRVEILEEIDAHLDDAVAERTERGEDPVAAEASAEARLGSPVDLARNLARPDQSAWRVLAGVGTAFPSGIGHWIYGYLFGALVIFVTVIALTAFVQAAGQVLEHGGRSRPPIRAGTRCSRRWRSVGLYFAGRVLPDRVALGSRRLVRDVRPWVVATATAGAFAFTTLVVNAPQNWASVAALIVAPAAIAVGAYRPNLLPGGVRLAAVAIVILLLVVGIFSVTLAAGFAQAGQAS